MILKLILNQPEFISYSDIRHQLKHPLKSSVVVQTRSTLVNGKLIINQLNTAQLGSTITCDGISCLLSVDEAGDRVRTLRQHPANVLLSYFFCAPGIGYVMVQDVQVGISPLFTTKIY